LDIRKNFFTESGKALEQAAKGSGGVTIPLGVQKTCRYDTSGLGFSGMVVVGLMVGLDDLRGLFQCE